MKTYNESESEALLEHIPGWEFEDNGIERAYEFENFVDAFSFLTRVAILSEKENHHAEIFNVYNQVNLRLTTHDANGLTQKDFDLAKQIDDL